MLEGKLVTPRGVLTGRLRFDKVIEEVEPTSSAAQVYILPGFIDTHVHGGAGGDTMDGAAGVRTLARFHLRRGTTTLYPTTMTAPWDDILTVLRDVRDVGQAHDLPAIPGVHLEGPFISPERLGAQPPFTVEPTPERVEKALASHVIKLVTLAPEVPGAVAAARRFAEAGVRVSVGHTTATFEQTRTLIEAVRAAGGVVGFTHLFNAMGGLKGREPGAVGAALADPESYAELIFDGHHVHAGSFLAALSAKPGHLHLVSDGIRACGSGEGETELGGQTVTVKGGAARLEDGTLAGSVLTLDQALRNAFSVGLPLETVSHLLSGVPARYMGLEDRGVVAVGKRADLVVLDEYLRVQAVYCEGRKVSGQDAGLKGEHQEVSRV